MRIWIGKEQEGRSKGTATMFIEAKEISPLHLEAILKCSQIQGINRLYLGAGKIDLIQFPTTMLETLEEKEVVVECSLENAKIWNPLLPYISELIIRIDDTEIRASNTKTVLKIDNGAEVALFYDRVVNSINTVTDGMYASEDKLIWED